MPGRAVSNRVDKRVTTGREREGLVDGGRKGRIEGMERAAGSSRSLEEAKRSEAKRTSRERDRERSSRSAPQRNFTAISDTLLTSARQRVEMHHCPNFNYSSSLFPHPHSCRTPCLTPPYAIGRLSHAMMSDCYRAIF